MSVRNLPNLFRRGDVYYFRRAIPKDICNQLHRAELNWSLKTRDNCTARIRCRLFANRFEQFVRDIRRMPHLDKKAIDQMLRSYFADLVSKCEEIVTLGPDDPLIDMEHEIKGNDELLTAMRHDMATGCVDKLTFQEARSIISQNFGPDIKVPADELRSIHNGILRARIESLRILQAMLQGRYDETVPRDPMFEGVVSPGLPTLLGEEPYEQTKTVGAIIEKYLDFKSTQDWVPKTAVESTRVLHWFRDNVGANRPLSSLDVEDVRIFRDLLIKLPKHASKDAADGGMTLQQIVENSSNGSNLSPSTLTKYYNSIRSFLSWCTDEYDINSAPLLKIKIAQKANKADA